MDPAEVPAIDLCLGRWAGGGGDCRGKGAGVADEFMILRADGLFQETGGARPGEPWSQLVGCSPEPDPGTLQGIDVTGVCDAVQSPTCYVHGCAHVHACV